LDLSLSPNVSRAWAYTYNSVGQILTEDGPRSDISDVTTNTYYSCSYGYECGQPHTVTNSLGHVTTYNSYNAHGQLAQVTDANGLVTSLAYDLRQRLTDRCVGGTLPGCVGGELTHLDYWPTGLLKRVTNPDGSYIDYVYDAAHRLTQIQDGALNRIEFTLDAMGNRTAENTFDPSNALRRAHTRVFNTLNQLWKDVNAAGTANVTTTFGYDNNGNQTSTAAPLSRNSSSLYDELNRLKQITDPASGVTQFGYDANDNLTSVTDPRSLVTSYTYNGFGDLKTQTSPDTGLTTNTYDSGGNLDTSTDSRGAITDYAYDALNRVTSASFTLGGVTDQTISYGYDAGTNQKGLITSASDAQHSLAWTYDAQGRITGKGQTVGGTTLAIGYGYNAAGQLGNTLLPSGANITYGYNANGQVTSVTLNGSTTILNNITYDPFGPITGWSWGNGSTASRDFDADGKVTQVDNANGVSLKNYGYDDAFRITGITDVGNSALSWTYGYDSLDRLNSATSTSVTQGWTHDANGNRLTQTGTTPSSYTNSGTSNRLSSVTGSLARTYGYDAAGNTLSYAGATFTYNHRGRMASASNAGTTAAYTYNALGQRIRRATSSLTTLYVYDEAGHLTGEYSSSGTLIQETVWLGDMPVATLRPDGSGGVILYYVHADHLNTPRLVTDTSNNIRWRWESDAFGASAPNENPAGVGLFEYNLRFPGQQYDAVVGLHYNYFRDYDSYSGRYLQSDLIGLSGGPNTFAYSGSDPNGSIDSLGLFRLGVVAQWDLVEELPSEDGGDRRGPGLTRPRVQSFRCLCTGCGDEWMLQECAAFLNIRVSILAGISAYADAAGRRAESEHVEDFKAGAPELLQVAENVEKRLRIRTFSSKKECVHQSAQEIATAMAPILDRQSIETIDRRHQGGGHKISPWL
jgi:RHS repeat-associated protein